MRELIDLPLLGVMRGQQFTNDPLQQCRVVWQMIEAGGSIRHESLNRPLGRRSHEISPGVKDYSDFAYRGRRFALSATPPRIKDNSVALIETPAASPITLGNSNVPCSSRLYHKA